LTQIYDESLNLLEEQNGIKLDCESLMEDIFSCKNEVNNNSRGIENIKRDIERLLHEIERIKNRCGHDNTGGSSYDTGGGFGGDFDGDSGGGNEIGAGRIGPSRVPSCMG
jgi:hypothetical protein